MYNAGLARSFKGENMILTMFVSVVSQYVDEANGQNAISHSEFENIRNFT